MAILKITRTHSTGPGQTSVTDVASGWDGGNVAAVENARNSLRSAGIEDFNALARDSASTHHRVELISDGDVVMVEERCTRGHAGGKRCRGSSIRYELVPR